MNDLDRVKRALDVLKEKENEENDDEEVTPEELSMAIQEYSELNDALSIAEDPIFDQDMDQIAKDSDEAYKELFDLGLNVETKYTAEIVSAAERFKSTQLAAKKAKVERKLKMIDLKLKERRLDLLAAKQSATLNQGVLVGEGDEIDDDRDSILDDDED